MWCGAVCSCRAVRARALQDTSSASTHQRVNIQARFQHQRAAQRVSAHKRHRSAASSRRVRWAVERPRQCHQRAVAPGVRGQGVGQRQAGTAHQRGGGRMGATESVQHKQRARGVTGHKQAARRIHEPRCDGLDRTARVTAHATGPSAQTARPAHHAKGTAARPGWGIAGPESRERKHSRGAACLAAPQDRTDLDQRGRLLPSSLYLCRPLSVSFCVFWLSSLVLPARTLPRRATMRPAPNSVKSRVSASSHTTPSG